MHRSSQADTANIIDSSDILYGGETAKALTNFTISEIKMPRAFIWALGELKAACAQANSELGVLGTDKSVAIQHAAQQVAKGLHDKQFPIDIFQTGSGTSTNMNANEVISSLVKRHSQQTVLVHPNDDVNLGQSSNDVIPSCIHISAAKLVSEELLPALSHLISTLDKKAEAHHFTIKTGRTHLMDAMPISFAQEIGAWRHQIQYVYDLLQQHLSDLCKLAIGGTAVGTGANTHPEFAAHVTQILTDRIKLPFRPADNYFRAISAQDTAVSLSGILKTTAVNLTKISNDIRWLSSGPLNGLNEIHLTELQKGSSIMPGKVNPVIPEAVLMGCAQVIGNDTTITVAAQSGQFQLNTMLPLIAHNLVQSIQILSHASMALADKVISDMQVNQQMISKNVAKNPILVTALTSLLGYEKCAEIAKNAYENDRNILDVALELTDLSEQELTEKLDPKNMI